LIRPTAFAAFTGDISPWWDHHFSPKPARLVIEPRPGGHFLEIFDQEGNGVVHGDVTWSERGKKLVIRGWLGPFHSMASVLVYTFTLEPAESGTQIKANRSRRRRVRPSSGGRSREGVAPFPRRAVQAPRGEALAKIILLSFAKVM